MSPFQGFGFAIMVTQGGAARLTPLRSALGWCVEAPSGQNDDPTAGRVAHCSIAPAGAQGCSHGWSKARGVRATRGMPIHDHCNRPGGAKDSSCPLSCDFPPPLWGGRRKRTTASTGFASRQAGTLHPWLQPYAPSGQKDDPTAGRYCQMSWIGS